MCLWSVCVAQLQYWTIQESPFRLVAILWPAMVPLWAWLHVNVVKTLSNLGMIGIYQHTHSTLKNIREMLGQESLVQFGAQNIYAVVLGFFCTFRSERWRCGVRLWRRSAGGGKSWRNGCRRKRVDVRNSSRGKWSYERNRELRWERSLFYTLNVLQKRYRSTKRGRVTYELKLWCHKKRLHCFGPITANM